MTVEEVKEMFRQTRKIQREINHIEKMINQEEAALMLPKAIVYDKDNIQVSVSDTLTNCIVDIIDLKAMLGESIYKLKKAMGIAESLIASLEDSDEREVMRYYYLDTKKGKLYTWNEIAHLLDYDERTIYRIHTSALKNISSRSKLS